MLRDVGAIVHEWQNSSLRPYDSTETTCEQCGGGSGPLSSRPGEHEYVIFSNVNGLFNEANSDETKRCRCKTLALSTNENTLQRQQENILNSCVEQWSPLATSDGFTQTHCDLSAIHVLPEAFHHFYIGSHDTQNDCHVDDVVPEIQEIGPEGYCEYEEGKEEEEQEGVEGGMSEIDKTINQCIKSYLQFRDEASRADDIHLTEESMNAYETEAYKSLVLKMCEQVDVLPFNEAFPDSCLNSCTKIGEGTYGEVFSIRREDYHSTLKIIPIEGKIMMNGGPQRSYREILEEMVIHKTLSNLHNGADFRTSSFVKLIRCWCVKGQYPRKLLRLWMNYRKSKGSDNRSPKVLRADQIYLIFESPLCGIPLEYYNFESALQIISAFQQITYSLAVAEKCFMFEHRDLHWSNVLIKKTDVQYVEFCLGGPTYCVETYGAEIGIIDFSLSRITFSLTDPDDRAEMFSNLAEDRELFSGKGDIQFQVYRHMQEAVKDEWIKFEPFTNVLWLEYVLKKCKKLLSSDDLKKCTYQKLGMSSLNRFLRNIRSCKSAEEATHLFEEL